jgi:hypothetical protein
MTIQANAIALFSMSRKSGIRFSEKDMRQHKQLVRGHQYEPAGFGDSLAVGLKTACDALAIGNEFRADGQRIQHARFTARLFVVRLARDRRKRKTKQHGRKYSAHFHWLLLTRFTHWHIESAEQKPASFSQERNEQRLYNVVRHFRNRVFLVR